MAKRPELRYAFHDPNAPDAAAAYVYKLCMQVAERKLDQERKKRIEVEKQQEGSR